MDSHCLNNNRLEKNYHATKEKVWHWSVRREINLFDRWLVVRNDGKLFSREDRPKYRKTTSYQPICTVPQGKAAQKANRPPLVQHCRALLTSLNVQPEPPSGLRCPVDSSAMLLLTWMLIIRSVTDSITSHAQRTIFFMPVFTWLLSPDWDLQYRKQRMGVCRKMEHCCVPWLTYSYSWLFLQKMSIYCVLIFRDSRYGK